ncbi:hypothetical protein BCV73_24285 [Paenibacillus sp. SSG-1]|uniref:hypothetical protein n=1 Tax=Paenibacillus sp. SSG-1 TaxID=1443669 RepID=UPI000B7EE188|nr:hypothetical protein [Paenibacillus sp. SSG-1]OXL85846.1 hypothetical protein BCV73_24285 [Paenibacillus sp. SSG-1]
MTNIYLDSYLLAYPSSKNESVTIEDFEEYLENLLSWRELRDVNWSDILIPKNTPNILMQYNNYPHWDDLKISLSQTGLNQIYQPKDIIELVDNFLHLKTIEDAIGINDILFDNVATSVDENVGQRPATYLHELNRVLMLISLNKYLFPSQNENYLITRNIGNSLVEVNGEIHDCEFVNEGLINSFPLTINGEIISCATLKDIILNIDPVNMWKNSRSIAGYIDALFIHVYQRMCFTGLDPENMPNWSFGKEFIETCREHGFLNNETKIRTLLRTCTDTILEVDLPATHALRTGSGGDNPQRKRGEDKAWRRDVDYEYHLHYWQTGRGHELASVVVHNDMSIPA